MSEPAPSWWPAHWQRAVFPPSPEALAIQARVERISIRPTKLFIQPALLHLAKEILLTAAARHAPLHRLRYRWSLRRRAPAWRQRVAKRGKAWQSAAKRGKTRGFAEALIDGARVEQEMRAARVLNEAFDRPWACPDCGVENPGSALTCIECAGMPIRRAA